MRILCCELLALRPVDGGTLGAAYFLLQTFKLHIYYHRCRFFRVLPVVLLYKNALSHPATDCLNIDIIEKCISTSFVYTMHPISYCMLLHAPGVCRASCLCYMCSLELTILYWLLTNDDKMISRFISVEFHLSSHIMSQDSVTGLRNHSIVWNGPTPWKSR